MGVRGTAANFYSVRSMSGEKTAVEMAIAAQPAPDDEAEQLDMLGLPENAKVIALRAEREGKIGRPKGARNRRTVEMADFLLRQFRSPLVTLAQIQQTPVDELAAALGCTALEALQEIRLAAIALKDHVHSKMPVAVDVTNHRIIHLTLEDPAPEAANDGDDHVTLVGEILSRREPDTG